MIPVLLALSFSVAANAPVEVRRAAATAIEYATGACGAQVISRFGTVTPAAPHVMFTWGVDARCERNRTAAAVASVGGIKVSICPAFLKLSDRMAAIILTHEVLHAMGLPEGPAYRNAPSSLEITAAIEECFQ